MPVNTATDIQTGGPVLPPVSAAVIARLFNLTERRIQQLAKQGILSKVAHGKYDLLTAVREYVAHLQHQQTSGGDDPEKMQPKERLDWYRGEAERMKIASRRQELYERAPTLHAFSTTIAVFAEQARAIPDILERRAGLNPKQAELTADEIDTQLEAIKKRLLDQIQSGQAEDAA